MTVEELIDVLLTMPEDLEVKYIFNGTSASVTDVDEGDTDVLLS